MPDGEIWHLLSVKRKMLPVFDRKLVLKAAIPGVDTTDGYIRHAKASLVDREKAYRLEEAAAYLTDAMTKQSAYQLAQSDLNLLRQETEERFISGAKEAEVPVDHYVRELLPACGVELGADLDWHQGVALLAEKQLKTILLGEYYLEQFGVRLGRDRYQAHLAKMAHETGLTVEKVRENLPFSAFLYQKCLVQLETQARKYIKANITYSVEVENEDGPAFRT